MDPLVVTTDWSSRPGGQKQRELQTVWKDFISGKAATKSEEYFKGK